MVLSLLLYVSWSLLGVEGNSQITSERLCVDKIIIPRQWRSSSSSVVTSNVAMLTTSDHSEGRHLQGVNCKPVFIAHQYRLNWYYSSRVLIRLNWWPRRGRLLGLYAHSTPVPDSARQFVQVRHGVVAKLAENYEMFAGLSSKKSILQQMKK